LINAPIDEDDGPLLGEMAAAVAGDSGAQQELRWLLDPARLGGASLEDAELAGRHAAILRWFALQFEGVGGVTLEGAAKLEEAAAAAVIEHLRAEIESPTIGRCRSCGAVTAPWATLCDRCFMSRGYRERRR
jgi:ribosomal protein L40E